MEAEDQQITREEKVNFPQKTGDDDSQNLRKDRSPFQSQSNLIKDNKRSGSSSMKSPL